MENREKKLLKNTAILSFGTLCTKAIMFILIPIITRLVSTESYGIFDLLTTYATLLIPVLTLGLGEGTFRFLIDSKSIEERKKIIINALISNVISFLLAIIVISVASVINSTIRQLAVLFFIYFIVEILFDTLGKVLRGLKMLNKYTISNILFVIGIGIGVGLFVWKLEMGLEGIIISYILGDLIAIIYMCIKSNITKLLSIKSFDKNIFIEMLKYSIPLIIGGISWWIVSVSDRTIVTIFLGANINGIYAIANKIPSLCQTFYNVFHLSWIESASETILDDDKDKYYNKVFNEIILVFSTISILILSTNFILFNYIFTEDYLTAFYHVPILVLATFFNMLATFFGGIYVANKQTNKQGNTIIISAIANIVIHLFLIKFIGLYAASISTLVSYILLYLIRYKDITKKIKIKSNKQTKLLYILLTYFFITIYINNLILNYINLILAIIIFIYFNKNVVKRILNKFLKGIRKNVK